VNRITVNGVDLAFVERGRGRAVLLVHGFPLDHTMWESQIDGLSAACRVIAPDLRGFGRSGATPGTVTMRRFAEDLAALLDALACREPVTVCGLSMGGYIALAFWEAFAARVGALVLCDTRAAADAPAAAAARLEMARRVLTEGSRPLVDQMLPRLLAAGSARQRPELTEALRRMIGAASLQGIAAAARGMAERADMTARLAHIACPALLVVGEEDVISPPDEMRAMAAAMPRAKLVTIRAAGHMAPMEQPADVNRAVARFLAESTATERPTGS